MEKHHALTFARCQPPTAGHSLVFNKTKEIGDQHKGTHEVILSKTQDAKKNPLSVEDKVKFAKHIAPDVHFRGATKEEPTIMHAAKAAHDRGVTHLHIIAGSDRKKEYEDLLHKYNGKEGHYNFKKITVHSAGERDPDAEGTTGISGTKMREHAKNNDIEAYKKGLPDHAQKHAGKMIKAVRKGMMLEMRTFKEYLTTELYEDWEEESETALYEEREVQLNKPFRTPGGPKKFSVYVKNENGNTVKVNFGDPGMKIKTSNDSNRASFRARHNCDEKKDKTSAGYWSCKLWSSKTAVKDNL